MRNDQNDAVQTLLRAFTQLRTAEECHAFLEDICTIKEIHDMAQRLQTAILLDRGCSYQKISDEVGISTATISRVNRCLNYGSGGYRNIIDRLDKTEETT